MLSSRRVAIYALLLAIAAGWVMFARLGAIRIDGDEALYALCTDQIRETGQWLTLRPRPPTPYFGKPPLYMWLTAATYRYLPGFEAKYRFWSAASGVFCVVLTSCLAAKLFQPETGLIAGGFLLTNRSFLEDHGVRYGGMDAMLTLILLLCLYLYWQAVAGRRSRWIWVGIGLLSGLAWLLKPLFGFPILLLLTVHALQSGRDQRKPLLIGLAAASSVMILVGLPWYIIQYARFGQTFTDAVFFKQVLSRATDAIHRGEGRGPAFYLLQATRSSLPFWFALPAIGYAVIRSLGGGTRKRFLPGGKDDADRFQVYSLLALWAGGWLVICSLVKTKFLHYAFPAYPAIAIAIAAVLFQGLQKLAERWRERGYRIGRSLAAAAFGLLGLVLLLRVVNLSQVEYGRQSKPYAAWELYQVFRPAIARGEVRVVAAGLPLRAQTWDLGLTVPPGDRFYLSHLRHAVAVDSPEQLTTILQARTPTLLLVSRLHSFQPVLDQAGLLDRMDERFGFEHRTYSVACIDTAAVLDPTLSAGVSTPYLSLVGKSSLLPCDFEETIKLRITPPLPEQTWVSVVIRPKPGAPPREIRYSVAGADHAQSARLATPFAGSTRLWAELGADRLRHGPTDITFFIHPAAGSPLSAPVVGKVTEVRLRVSPPIPSDEGID